MIEAARAGVNDSSGASQNGASPKRTELAWGLRRRDTGRHNTNILLEPGFVDVCVLERHVAGRSFSLYCRFYPRAVVLFSKSAPKCGARRGHGSSSFLERFSA
jgi:hypothetical protein